MGRYNFNVCIKVIGRANTNVNAPSLEEARIRNIDAVKNVFIGKLHDVTWDEREVPFKRSDTDYRFFMRATGYLDITVTADDIDEARLEVDYTMYDIETGYNDMVGDLTAIGWNIHEWLERTHVE